MSFRPLLAGPSRGSVGALKTPLVRPRRYLTIPHPDLALPEGKRGANRFVISLPIGSKTDMPHAFAYLRAVEGALGTSIISIDVAHDHDDLQPLRFITFTTLYPVDFKEPIWVKMKKPKVAPYDMYGGPSLESVYDAFRQDVELAKDDQDCVSFKIEVDTTRRKGTSRTAEIKGNARNSRFARTQQDKLLDLLETLGGDWEKVARKYEHLRRETPASSQRGLDEILASEDGSFADGLDERLDGELVHAQRREAKHRRHAEETAGSEQLGEGENVIAQRRQHAEEAREARHRLRAAREAERQAVIHDAEASTWKFEIGSSEATPAIEQTDAPVDSSAIRFNLPKASRSSRSTSAFDSTSATAMAQSAKRISDEQARLLVEKKIKERLKVQRPASSPRPDQSEPIEQEPIAEPVETVEKVAPQIEAPSAPLAESPAPAVKGGSRKSRKESRAAEKKVKENKAESEAASSQAPSRAAGDSEPVQAVKGEAATKAGKKETEVESQSQENKEAQQSTNDDGKKRSFWGRLLG